MYRLLDDPPGILSNRQFFQVHDEVHQFVAMELLCLA